MAATFRSPGDTNAKEIFVNHTPGMAAPNGHGGSSALDTVALRDKDANAPGAWTAAMDGAREERSYYCQNPRGRGDVVAVFAVGAGSNGGVREFARYSSYGVPFGLPRGDLDGDSDVDAADGTLWTVLSGGAYDVRADLNLDGAVDITDDGIMTGAIAGGAVLGRGNLSAPGVGNRKGYAGYEHDGNIDTFAHVRNRVLLTELGRWSRRDPLGYVDGMSVYGYVESQPISAHDATGLVGRPAHVDVGCFDSDCSGSNLLCPFAGLRECYTYRMTA